MIIDSETTIVYFSEHLDKSPYYPAFKRSKRILEEENITYQLLKGTKDIWARDYMPIQVRKDKFVQFRYEPSYLKLQRSYQTDPRTVHQLNGFNVIYSDINLDGGNVVKWIDKVILTDRIFDENPALTQSTIISELEKLLEAEIIIIPQHQEDPTGHSDGMIRFIDANTVLVNDMSLEEPTWADKLKRVLKTHQIDFVNLPFFESKKAGAIGLYINYLEVANLILVPIYETPVNKDQAALNVFKEVFSDRIVRSVNVNEIARDGGVLNCVSWTL